MMVDISQDAVKKRFRLMGARPCHSRDEASMFVVVDLDKPGNRIKWLCSLLGRGMMDQHEDGPFVFFEPAIEKRWHLWLSKETCEKHPGLCDTIRTAITCSNNRWKLLASKAQYICQVKSSYAICSQREIGNDHTLRSSKTVFTKEKFLTHISKVRLRRLSLAGMC